MKTFVRSFVSDLETALEKYPKLIHVVLGPRQVGKTTGIHQLMERKERNQIFYVSADGDIQRPSSWILQQWLAAESKGSDSLLIIDEIQKVENWSEAVKQLWDAQKFGKKQANLKLILLGSSSLEIQSGLSESLVGRYQLHQVTHWGYHETKKAFQMSLDDYLCFGGYPGSYAFASDLNVWLDYLKNSIINPVLGKDILSVARVKSPALFKQCFDIACSYGGQEISYTKLLGQIQDKGNTDLVKYYLQLFEGAYMIKSLFKYSGRKLLARTSSPKILPLCPALLSVTSNAELSDTERGRAFEIAVGGFLSTLPGELYYWREKNFEVDFVLKRGKKIWGIEVKWGKKTAKGLERFNLRFPEAQLMLIDPEAFIKLTPESFA